LCMLFGMFLQVRLVMWCSTTLFHDAEARTWNKWSIVWSVDFGQPFDQKVNSYPKVNCELNDVKTCHFGFLGLFYNGMLNICNRKIVFLSSLVLSIWICIWMEVVWNNDFFDRTLICKALIFSTKKWFTLF
jgi:hypothetical protein